MLKMKLLSKPSKMNSKELSKKLEICPMKNFRALSLIILRVALLINVIDQAQLRMMMVKASKKVNSVLQRYPILMKKRSKMEEMMVKKRTTRLLTMITKLKRRSKVVMQDRRHKSQIDLELAKREKQLLWITVR